MTLAEIPKSEATKRPILLLHYGFFLCGIATALPGAILPLFLKQWSLTDFHAGSLIATQFCTSALGSLLVARQRHKSVKYGCGLAAIGFLLLAAGLRLVDFAAFAAIGLGIGMAMTSTSLLVSEIYPNSRASALSLLNFSWGAGAALSPVLVRLAAQHASEEHLFEALAFLFGTVLVVMLARLEPQSAMNAEGLRLAPRNSISIYFAVMLFLYVGVESSIGNWVTTYAERSSAIHHFPLAPYVASFFWAALLLGRVVTPLLLKTVSETALHLLTTSAALIAVALLLPIDLSAMVIAVAIFAGLSLAPIFPLDLSALIARSPARSQLGWVFGVAGFGGACFTWFEGWLSTSTGSLRSAFWAPLAAMVLMLAMTFIYPRRW